MTKVVKTPATVKENSKGEKVVAPGVTGKKLTQTAIPGTEVVDPEAEKKAAEKAEAEAAKAAAKAEKDAAKEALKAEKEAAKAEMDEAKKLAADAREQLKAEKAEALKLQQEAKDKVNAEKKEALELKKKERTEAAAKKAEAKANRPETGADLIRKDYKAFEPTETEKEYTVAGAAARLNIPYARVYGCIQKLKEAEQIEAIIAQRRAEKAAQQ